MKRMFPVMIALLALSAMSASAALLPSYGVKAGLNLSSIDIEDIESSSQSGFVGGFFADLASPLLHLQAELLYTARESQLGALNTSAYDIDVRNHYIQIPVLVKFGLPVPAIAPSVYAGPAIAFPIKSEMTDAGGDYVDVKDYSKSAVWSLSIGADLTLLEKIVVDIRYDIALTALNDVPVGDILDDINDEFTEGDSYRDLKDRTFSVMAGFRF